jgi:hypothetical protein
MYSTFTPADSMRVELEEISSLTHASNCSDINPVRSAHPGGSSQVKLHHSAVYTNGANVRSWPFATAGDTGGPLPRLYVRLLGDLERVVDFDSEVSHGALELRVTK